MNKQKGEIRLLKKYKEATLYTIIFEGEELSEFEKFVKKFKGNVETDEDLSVIIQAIVNITEKGVLERYFRPEGKMADNVVALPISSCKLRLYCIRLTDKILILGNGGIKDSRTYNENLELCGYITDLQKFDAVIRRAVKTGTITIEETEITGINTKIFDL